MLGVRPVQSGRCGPWPPGPVRSADPVELLTAARRGDRGALGRLLSLVERGGDLAGRVASLTYPAGASEGPGATVGITGAPGAGKSTLTSALVGEARRRGGRVGVLAVDPSSPLSGGAILGDRVRMQEHTSDPGVFIRSFASRGHLGGLSLAVPAAVRLLGVLGYPTVLVETVGVGQAEVDVAGETDTTVVVVTPGWGDSVQVAKAGLLELADVFVVNKADRPGAAETRRELEAMLDLDEPRVWRPPVLLTCASEKDGVAELWSAIEEHRDTLGREGLLEPARRRRLVEEFERTLLRRLAADLRRVEGGAAYERARGAVAERLVDPQLAAAELVAALASSAH